VLGRRTRDDRNGFHDLPPGLACENLRDLRGGEPGSVRQIAMSAELYRRGFYSSAVFFPIVPKGEAGLRVMVRADLERDELAAFAGHLNELVP